MLFTDADDSPFQTRKEHQATKVSGSFVKQKVPKIIAIKYQMYDPFEGVDPFQKGSKSKVSRFEEKDPFNASESTKETKYSHYLL